MTQPTPPIGHTLTCALRKNDTRLLSTCPACQFLAGVEWLRAKTGLPLAAIEELLVLRKPADAAGPEPAVDCVLTSPPYEAALTGDGHSPLAGTPPRPGDVRKYPRKASGYGYTRPQETKPMEVKRG